MVACGCLPPACPPIAWLDDVDSTNSYVVSQFERLGHGVFVAARRQHAGRGRLERSWHSPRGNVYMTAVVKPPQVSRSDDLGAVLTLSMATSVCDVLDGLGVETAVKWPNDVLVGHEKIGGVLAQGIWEGDRFAGAAVGVGINVNMSRREIRQIDRPATSLYILTGKRHEADDLARRVACRFLSRLSEVDRSSLRAEVLRRSRYLGTALSVRTASGEVAGRALALDPSFSLVLADSRGVRHTIRAGDLL